MYNIDMKLAISNLSKKKKKKVTVYAVNTPIKINYVSNVLMFLMFSQKKKKRNSVVFLF